MRDSVCYKLTALEHEFPIEEQCGGCLALRVRSTSVDQTQPREAGSVLKEGPRLDAFADHTEKDDCQELHVCSVKTGLSTA